mmetsp:Transcript_96733/g.288900  ORF Transcript_96733/g.288900 Transcript_96733/m.288900 type:complete len:225 (-) Transcript_96733:96-770(-)
MGRLATTRLRNSQTPALPGSSAQSLEDRLALVVKAMVALAGQLCALLDRECELRLGLLQSLPERAKEIRRVLRGSLPSCNLWQGTAQRHPSCRAISRSARTSAPGRCSLTRGGGTWRGHGWRFIAGAASDGIRNIRAPAAAWLQVSSRCLKPAGEASSADPACLLFVRCVVRPPDLDPVLGAWVAEHEPAGPAVVPPREPTEAHLAGVAVGGRGIGHPVLAPRL